VESVTPAKIIKACRAGARLCKGYNRAGAVFTIQPDSRRIKTHYALTAIASGKLLPARDALFADGNTQSWAAKPAPPSTEFRGHRSRARRPHAHPV
jgi:hypothetical protein